MDPSASDPPSGWTAEQWTTFAENANANALAWYSILANRPIVPTLAGQNIPAVLPAAAPYVPGAAIGSNTLSLVALVVIAFLLFR